MGVKDLLSAARPVWAVDADGNIVGVDVPVKVTLAADLPAPVVNVPAPVVNVPAPVVNVPERVLHVRAPDVHVTIPDNIKVPVPVVNVSPPAVNVSPPAVNVSPAVVNVPEFKPGRLTWCWRAAVLAALVADVLVHMLA